MSLHQLSEICHVLAYRGRFLGPKTAPEAIIESITRSDNVVIMEVKRAHFNEGLKHSI